MKTFLFSLLLCALSVTAQTEKYYLPTEVDQKVVVTKRPQPKGSRPCVESSGLTVLRVFFHKSATIDHTEMVRPSSCPQFDQSAVDAASGIKFKPAVKDGQPVSYVTVVEYKWLKY